MNGTIDYYIGQNPETISPNLIYTTGATWQYCAIIPSTSTLYENNKKVLTPGTIPMRALLNEKLLLTSNGSAIRRQVNHLLNKYEIEPTILVESNNIFTIANLSMQGAGVAIVPRPIISIEKNYNIYPIANDLIDLEFFIAYSENKIIGKTGHDLINSFNESMKLI